MSSIQTHLLIHLNAFLYMRMGETVELSIIRRRVPRRRDRWGRERQREIEQKLLRNHRRSPTGTNQTLMSPCVSVMTLFFFFFFTLIHFNQAKYENTTGCRCWLTPKSFMANQRMRADLGVVVMAGLGPSANLLWPHPVTLHWGIMYSGVKEQRRRDFSLNSHSNINTNANAQCGNYTFYKCTIAGAPNLSECGQHGARGKAWSKNNYNVHGWEAGKRSLLQLLHAGLTTPSVKQSLQQQTLQQVSQKRAANLLCL